MSWRRSKRPRNLLGGTYGSPVHPIIVTVPIGAWFASPVFDVASHVGTEPRALSAASTRLIGIGAAGAVGAAGAGFMDLLQVPAGSHVLRLGVIHMGLNLTATTLYVANFLMRWHGDAERPVPPSLIALSGAAFALLAGGSHIGGLLAYRYGVRVADEATQRQGFGSAAGVDEPGRG